MSKIQNVHQSTIILSFEKGFWHTLFAYPFGNTDKPDKSLWETEGGAEPNHNFCISKQIRISHKRV